MKVGYLMKWIPTLMIVSFRFVLFHFVWFRVAVLRYSLSLCLFLHPGLRRNRHSPALEYSTLGYLIRLGGMEGTWEWSGHVSSGLYFTEYLTCSWGYQLITN